jgi:hypothetical protein
MRRFETRAKISPVLLGLVRPDVILILYFVLFRQQIWPPRAIIVSDWLMLKKSSPLKLLGKMEPTLTLTLILIITCQSDIKHVMTMTLVVKVVPLFYISCRKIPYLNSLYTNLHRSPDPTQRVR